ncbi:transposase DNA-binding-containing protein [Caballeronia sp. 15711]|uniref:IS4/Tn5 family transposase DNA-binding protein n=1 Tax=Caballeronia sp. 15711 TaxID=3391029 RepID=UPI0039E2CC71
MVEENDTDDRASTEFGDARLAQRLVVLAHRLACSPQGSFPQSLKPAELKAAYRFFDNTQIDTDGILAPHIAQTLDRMRQVPVVLAIQDTTEFNLSHLHATEGLGYGAGGNERGFMMHSLLAVTPEGLPLGVLGMKTWVRAQEEAGKGRECKARPIAEKESMGSDKSSWPPPTDPRAFVLAAAAVLFGDADSPRTVTMEAIATAAGVGKGTLFRAFGSRDGLLDALWAAGLGDVRAVVEKSEPPFGPEAPTRDRVIAFLDALLTLKLENRHLIRACEVAPTGLRQTNHYRWKHDLLQRMIEDAAPGAVADDAGYVAHVLLTALHIDLVDELLAAGRSPDAIGALRLLSCEQLLTTNGAANPSSPLAAWIKDRRLFIPISNRVCRTRRAAHVVNCA